MSNFQIPIHDLIVTSPVFSSYKYETVICNRCEMVTCYKYETFNFSYKIFVVKICNSYLLKYETFICYKYETFTCYKYETFKFSSRILFLRHRGPGHSLFNPLNFLNRRVFSLETNIQNQHKEAFVCFAIFIKCYEIPEVNMKYLK